MSSHSPAPSPVGMRAALHRGKATDDSILQPSSSTGMGAATQVAASSGQLLTSAVFEAGTLVTLPITPRGQSAVTSAFHLTGMQAVSPSAATITLASSPAQDAHGQRGAVPSAGGPPCRALFGPAMRLPDGAVCAVGYAPSQGTVRMAGDIPAWWADGVAEMWHGIQLARARFASHSVAVAPPPKHSRWILVVHVS